MATTSTPASLPIGSYAASVVYGKTLLARMIQQRTFKNKLTGPIPTEQWLDGVKRSETSHGYPIVQINDLTKLAGDQVTCDILNRVGGKPVMGDKIAKDQGTKIEILRDSAFINQSRKVLDAGGRMSQQRTPHQLRNIARELAVDYFRDLEDNLAHVHMAGSRGDATGIQWKMPLASDPDFTEIAVNPVLAPRFSRYLGLTSSITEPSLVSTTNVVTLNSFDRFRTMLDTSAVPLQGVRLEGADGSIVEGEESPLLVSFISAEQWNQLLTDTSTQNYRTFIASATDRLAWTKHPLFRSGQCGLWRDILVCQTPRPIQFSVGFTAKAYATAGASSETDSVAAVRIHRGVILGAQALAAAYGNAERWTGGGQGTRGAGQIENMNVPYSWVEKLEDGDNLLQLFAGVMNGFKKLVYSFDDVVYDNGVAVFDSYVPALT